ncbi:MAG: hypothetical protein IJO74_06790 [Clostridia bacterium]|nr:hypothetical protein [Clostridia bacterium]
MSKKLSFVALLMVIVTLFAMTAMVSAAGEVVLTRTQGDPEMNVESTYPTVITLTNSINGTIEWYKKAASDRNGLKLQETGTTLTISSYTEGTDFYYAVVTTDTNDKFVSNEIKVTGYVEIVKPIVWDAEDLMSVITSGDAPVSLIPGGGENGVDSAVRTTILGNNPSLWFSGIDIDLTKTPLMVRKYRWISGDHAGGYFHVATNGREFPTSTFLASEELPLPMNKWEERVNDFSAILSNTDHTLNDLRWDYANYGGGSSNANIEIEYIGFFADGNQYAEWRANRTPGSELPELDVKAWEFVDEDDAATPDVDESINGVNFTNDFFGGMVAYENGAKLLANTDYLAFIKTKDKFDLNRYSVVKVLYNAVQDTKLSLFEDGVKVGEIELKANKNEAIVDFTDDANMPANFNKLSIKADKDVTISSIAFLINNADAAAYKLGYASFPGVSGTIEYDDAIWWNFADIDLFYVLQPENGDVEFNAGDNISGPDTITVTAKQDGAVTLSLTDIHLKSAQRLEDVASFPYISVAYSGDVLAGKPAYIKFKPEGQAAVTVNFTWPAVGAVTPISNEAVNYGLNKMVLDFSSANAIALIDHSANAEWTGNIENVEIGIGGLSANDAFTLSSVNFFEFADQSTAFDGTVAQPPKVSATWKVVTKVMTDYITIEQIDIEADQIEYAIDSNSRISRIALTELRDEIPGKLITLKADGYFYEFYPKNLLDNAATWYYDLEVAFDGSKDFTTNHKAISELAAEKEGEVVSSVYFRHKFVRDRSMPFKGKFGFEVGEEYNDKYLDVYKYNQRDNLLELVEHAPVVNGVAKMRSIGGEYVIMDSGYEPSEDELKYYEALEVYENTEWNFIKFDYSDASGNDIAFTSTNSEVTKNEENGVVFYRVKNIGGGLGIRITPSGAAMLELSEHPVLVFTYRTNKEYSNNGIACYYETDFYQKNNVGYEWYKQAAYYDSSAAFKKTNEEWKNIVIDYSSPAAMKKSGLNVSDSWNGQSNAGIAPYDFKGSFRYLRFDFPDKVNATFDLASILFFTNGDEARSYVESKEIVEKYEASLK